MPKNIEVEYEEVPEEPDYMIMEKSFQNMRKPAVEVKAKGPARQGATTAQSTSDKGATLEQKKQARLLELQAQYDTVRAKPFSMAAKLKLNVYPPAKPSEPTPEPSKAELTQPPDSKMTKGASKVAGKKK